MKKIVFIDILLLSQSSKKSKKVEFDEKFNVIVGKNSTGKSSLLKSIYWTFGAEPYKTHPKWKNENVISLVNFKIIDNNKIDYYSILRNGDLFCLFDEYKNKIKIFTSVTKELSPYLNELLDFRIQINNRQNEITGLTPNYLFLPFYIDQDISWSKNWSSFSNLGQFPTNWKQSLIDFYVGIKPNEYYDIKGEINKNKNILNELNKEKSILDNLKVNIDKKFIGNKDFTNIHDFQNEINDLLEEMKVLSDKKNKYILDINTLNNKKLTLLEQINYTSRNLKNIKIHYDFLMDEKHQLECPVCGSNHENSFKERFEIAKDEDNCNILLLELKEELDKIENEIKSTTDKHDELKNQFDKVNKIVIQKKSNIKLIDIIKSEGKKEVRQAFINESDELNIKIGNLISKNNELNDDIKKYIDKKRSDSIKSEYLINIKKNFNELDVINIPENSYKKINSEIKETGSNTPRALMAYYLTILKLINKYSTSSFCPIIIDSPNQQGQDDSHLPMILNFIKNNNIEDSQIILGIEDKCDIDFNGKTIELTKTHSLLEENNYTEHFSYLKTYLDNSLK